MTTEFPVFPGQAGRSTAAPGPLPDDLRDRLDLMRELVPQHILRGAVIDSVDAPDIPTAAVLDSAVETFALAGGGSLEFIVDEYDGSNHAHGIPATLRSAVHPASSLLVTADRFNIDVAGDGAQEVELGAQASGAGIAAAIQAGVRALTATAPSLQAALDSFVCIYSPVTGSKLLKSALVNGTAYDQLVLDSVQGLRRGQSLTLRGTPVHDVVIQDIFWASKTIVVDRFTAGANYPVNSVVDSNDDYYLMTTGKHGANMSIVVTNATTQNAAGLLKLRVADSAIPTSGSDAIGQQSVPYVDADFTAPAAATAAEVAVVINKVLTGVIASDATGKVRLTSRRLGAAASVRALPGDAIDKLGYAAVEQVGTETQVALSLDTPVLTAIVPYTIATGALGNAIVGQVALDAVVRQRRKYLENVSGADKSAVGTVAWLVISKPSQ